MIAPAFSLIVSVLSPPAEQAALGLGWDAPVECGDREQAIARLGELLPGLPPPTQLDEEARLRAEVEIIEAEGIFQTTVRFDGPRGHDERSFEDPRCPVVAEAALVVIAVSLDPIAIVDGLGMVHPTIQRPEPEPEPDSEPEPDPEPELEPTPELEPKRDPASSRGGTARDAPRPDGRVRGGLGLLAGGGYGPLDMGQASIGVDLSVFGPWWRATLRGTWHPARTVELDGGDTARFDGFAAALRGCGVPSARGPKLEFPLCVGVEGGLMRGEGTGTTPSPRRGNQPQLALTAGPGLRWAVQEHLAFVLEVDVSVSLLRGGFVIGDTTLASLAPVGARGLAGIELRFP